MTTSVASTQNFFVRSMSRNAAQNGLSDHAIPMLAVPTVISASDRPRSLNIVPATQITIAKGMPSARYAVGTQAPGCLARTERSRGAGTGVAVCTSRPEDGYGQPVNCTSSTQMS